MRSRALLLVALFVPSMAAVIACSSDSGSSGTGGADGGADATVDGPAPGVDSGGDGSDAATNGDGAMGGDSAAADAGAITDPFCIAWKAFLDRCGKPSNGCFGANLSACGLSNYYNDDYKAANETCQPQMACDAGFPDDIDPCVKAKMAGIPPTAAVQKLHDDTIHACDPDAGPDTGVASRGLVNDTVIQDVDTTCIPQLKLDAGTIGCELSIFSCEVKVAKKYLPVDQCADAGTD